MSRRRTLTELEGAVLGELGARGPCTPYSVRREFLDSPSPYWSGSAGAIYPLLRRLESLQLVQSLPSVAGRRRSRLYSLTKNGRDALKEWLKPPLPEIVIGVPADPLRTRLSFLSALSQAERFRFVSETQKRVNEHLRSVRRDVERHRRSGDPYAFLVAKGALAALRGRLIWLSEVARAEEFRSPS
jgi:DNA-binding PadR family transcriptional regulator